MEIELNINDAIKELNTRYKDREQFEFMQKIDVLIAKIDVLSDIKSWIFFIEHTYLECYIKSTGEEYSKILKEAEFIDEHNLYFIYKVLLELYELDELNKAIKIRIKVYTGHSKLNLWKHKVFIQSLLNISQSINLTKTELLENLDKLGQDIEYHNKIKMHENTKSISAYLLDEKKLESFRVNTKSKLTYKIKKITRDKVKEIKCPVCSDKKKLYWNNKNQIFHSSRTKVTFICDHIGSEYYERLPVVIDIKKYKKELQGIDELDWVIYNYHPLFEEFMNNLTANIGLDYVI